MPKKLTQEEIQAIDNYSNEIKKFKDFQTGVRNRPGMYIGSLQNKGLKKSFRMQLIRCWMILVHVIMYL